MHVLWSAYLLVAVAVQCPAHSQPGCFSVCQKRQLLAAASTGGFLKQQLRGVSRRFACMHACSLAALQPHQQCVCVTHITDPLLRNVACAACLWVCGVRACRFSVAAVREVCIRSCTCPRHPQSDEDVVMAKELGALPWVPMNAVGPAGLQGPQAGQQMSPHSPRLAIALQ